jgi:1-phosphofructokinase
MIIVNLNPCIDWQCTVPQVVHGGLNRVKRTRADIAGKGINVAAALKNLGHDPLCTGFNFAENGALLTQRLDTLGVRHDFIEAEGAVRVNMKLYEESTGIMTEFNQSGAFVSENAQNELLEKIKNFKREDDILVISGSRPEGVSADFYARICGAWRGRIFLDTEGEALIRALESAELFALKPNLFELESTFGVKLKTPREIADFCRERLISRGVKIVCVSMGAEGAVLVTSENAYFCPALDISAKGVHGAGDAMVAGLIHADKLPEEELLPSATAAASATVILEGTQMCTLEGFSEMRSCIFEKCGIIRL